MFHKDGSSITSSSSSSSNKNSNGKKYKDVTLRKSERKELLRAVLSFFHLQQQQQQPQPSKRSATTATTTNTAGTTNTTTTTTTTTTDYQGGIIQQTTSIPVSSLESEISSTPIEQQQQQLLDDIFVRNGEIYERTMNRLSSISSFVSLHETWVVTVHQYYRSPTTTSSSSLSSSLSMHNSGNNAFTSHHCTTWPYTLYAQCVWMKIQILDSKGGNTTTTATSAIVHEYHIPGLALLSVLPPSLFSPCRLTTVPSPLSEYICTNGIKHIMRVGLRSIPVQHGQPTTTPTAMSDRKFGITTMVCVQGNPQPICVGILHPDLLDINSNNNTDHDDIDNVPPFGPGCRKGTIGVAILHAYGDDIWRQQLPTNKEIDQLQQHSIIQSTTVGPSTLSTTTTRSECTFRYNPLGHSFYDLGQYGNVGFIDGKYVKPIIEEEQQQLQENEVDDNDEGMALEIEPSDTVMEIDDQIQVTDGDSNEAIAMQQLEEMRLFDNASTEKDRTIDINSDPVQNTDESNPTHDDGSTSTMNTPDEVLHDAVCRALVKLSGKNDLPMTMATFYAQHVLPNRRGGTTIQLKQTRYKKFSVYVKEQIDDGLILVGKQVSSNNVTDPVGMLIGFDRKHSDLVPYYMAQREFTATLAEAGIVLGVPKRLEIADLYCVPNHFVSLLRLDVTVVKAVEAKSEERRGTGMLTAKEVRTILEEYITNEGLIDVTHPDTVILNGPLTDALYKKKTKKLTSDGVVNSNELSTPLRLQRKELIKLWMACQESAYALVQLPGNIILKLKRGKPPVITIEVSRRQSKKYVTTVIGLELYDIHLPEFAKDVANRFACASTIDTESTSAATDVVVVQGNLSVELEALLLADETLTEHGGVKGSTYYLPKNSIRIVLKKGVPPRKKTQTRK